VSLPGVCAIGTRPVDFFLMGLEKLGAKLDIEAGYVVAKAPGGLVGGRVRFPHVSVGATHTIMMAATLAKGETTIENAAREPEIGDLARCLNAMGARIEGVDTETLRIQGVERLHGCRHRIIPDRVETGTYLMATAICDGDVELLGASLEHVGAVAKSLEEAGLDIAETNLGLRVRRANGPLTGVDVMTEPFPGFPTDLQAQMMSVMATATGASMITETIFENRFMHVPELCRMGANINVHGASAMVRGVPRLTGAPVMATDLRASVSLVLAGLAAQGETMVNRVYHLDRGYERLEEKLAACGADIERIAAG
jgi:UDP-N-acetylglucosamine 1-carboxyvinyltransferase